MALLKPGEIKSFLARGAQGQSLVLIFGPDEGLVRTRVRTLIQNYLGAAADPLSLVELEPETLQQDPARLLDETQAIGMFGGPRLILVRQAGKCPKAAWQPLVEHPPRNVLVVFQGDDLSKAAPLRVQAEKSSDFSAIICYPQSIQDVQAEIDDRCRLAGLSITPAARVYLAELLGADQALSGSELDKLMLYCQNRLAVEVADIDAVIANAATAANFEPIDRAFEGKLEDVERFAQQSFREGINGSALLLMAISHGLQLRTLLSARQAGGFETAFRQARLFFRRQDRIRHQLERWQLDGLNRALELLFTAQDQGRRNPALADTLAVRALWAIALAARRR